MKKLLFPLFYLAIAGTLHSQVKFGVKTNLQFTNVTDIHVDSNSKRFGLALGGVVQIPLGDSHDNFALRPEIIYSQQGEYDDRVKYFQDYINVPVMLKYYLSNFITLDKNGDAELFVEGGPQISFLIYQKNKEMDNKYYGNIKKFDFSLGLGLGVSLWRSYELGARYNYGLIDSYKDYPKRNATSNFAVSFSYLF